MDWLIRCGYLSTLNKLPGNTCEDDFNLLDYRAEVIRLVRGGLIIDAISLIQEHWKQFVGEEPLQESLFLLKLQHFIELIRKRDTSAALSWIQNEVLPHVTSEFEPVFQEYLGILAYSDPESSPCAFYFETKHRLAILASAVNRSLYTITASTNNTTESSSGSVKVSPIEMLIKQVHAIDELVRELKGFPNELDDRKWATLQNLLDPSFFGEKMSFIKTLKND